MSNKSRLIFFVVCLVIVQWLTPGHLLGQAYYKYHPRNGGEYSEGQLRERDISGIVVSLRSLSATIARSPEDTIGIGDTLHLVFGLPPTMSSDHPDIDISIKGPRDYLLDKVNRAFDAELNVFSWSSEVVAGMELELEELEPCVNFVGGLYIPSLLRTSPPSSMPEIESYRAVIETNESGTLRYAVRESGVLVDEGNQAVQTGIPVEFDIPARSDAHHLDLYVTIEYETGQGMRSITSCFPIQSSLGHAAAPGAH